MNDFLKVHCGKGAAGTAGMTDPAAPFFVKFLTLQKKSFSSIEGEDRRRGIGRGDRDVNGIYVAHEG